jgi:hypothetical protein
MESSIIISGRGGRIVMNRRISFTGTRKDTTIRDTPRLTVLLSYFRMTDVHKIHPILPVVDRISPFVRDLLKVRLQRAPFAHCLLSCSS